MSQIDKKTGKPIAPEARTGRVRDAFISLLATPLNLIFIALRLIWQGRKTRLAAVSLLVGVALAAVFRFDIMAPLAERARAEAYALSAHAGFYVNDITVEGRKRTQRADLIAAIDVPQGHPIFNLDLKDLHARIEALPWVEDAIVLRRLPNVVHIDLTEREPFAFYLEADKLALIDKKGVTITRRHLSGFSHLPVFSGAGATLRAAAFMEVLRDYPVVMNRMVAAHWTGNRRWTLKLDHGGRVHLPEGNIDAALDRLMQLEKSRRILAVERQDIDLRLPDRVLLRPDSQRSEGARISEVAS